MVLGRGNARDERKWKMELIVNGYIGFLLGGTNVLEFHCGDGCAVL